MPVLAYHNSAGHTGGILDPLLEERHAAVSGAAYKLYPETVNVALRPIAAFSVTSGPETDAPTLSKQPAKMGPPATKTTYLPKEATPQKKQTQ